MYCDVPIVVAAKLPTRERRLESADHCSHRGNWMGSTFPSLLSTAFPRFFSGSASTFFWDSEHEEDEKHGEMLYYSLWVLSHSIVSFLFPLWALYIQGQVFKLFASILAIGQPLPRWGRNKLKWIPSQADTSALSSRWTDSKWLHFVFGSNSVAFPFSGAPVRKLCDRDTEISNCLVTSSSLSEDVDGSSSSPKLLAGSKQKSWVSWVPCDPTQTEIDKPGKGEKSVGG